MTEPTEEVKAEAVVEATEEVKDPRFPYNNDPTLERNITAKSEAAQKERVANSCPVDPMESMVCDSCQ